MRWVLRSFFAWLSILLLAILNGVLRETVLVAHLSKDDAYLASGLLLSCVIVIAATAVAPWLRLRSAGHAMKVGALWLGLTLVFEFAFGALVLDRSLSDMLAAYRFEHGNIWPAVLAVILLAPLIARAIRSGESAAP